MKQFLIKTWWVLLFGIVSIMLLLITSCLYQNNRMIDLEIQGFSDKNTIVLELYDDMPIAEMKKLITQTRQCTIFKQMNFKMQKAVYSSDTFFIRQYARLFSIFTDLDAPVGKAILGHRYAEEFPETITQNSGVSYVEMAGIHYRVAEQFESRFSTSIDRYAFVDLLTVLESGNIPGRYEFNGAGAQQASEQFQAFLEQNDLSFLIQHNNDRGILLFLQVGSLYPVLMLFLFLFGILLLAFYVYYMSLQFKHLDLIYFVVGFTRLRGIVYKNVLFMTASAAIALIGGLGSLLLLTLWNQWQGGTDWLLWGIAAGLLMLLAYNLLMLTRKDNI